MVDRSRHDPKARSAFLAEILKALRRMRRKRPPEVAAAMGIARRSYEYFEAGKGRLNVDRIHRFAEAIRADPYGVFVALDIGSPAFALRTADNKFMTVFMIALQDFDANTQDAIAHLDAYVLMDAFTELFDKLGKIAREQEAIVRRWRRDEPGGESDD